MFRLILYSRIEQSENKEYAESMQRRLIACSVRHNCTEKIAIKVAIAKLLLQSSSPSETVRTYFFVRHGFQNTINSGLSVFIQKKIGHQRFSTTYFLNNSMKEATQLMAPVLLSNSSKITCEHK